MKKYLFCLVLMIFLGQAAYGQSIDELLNKASKAENIERVKIGRFFMSLGKIFGGVGNMPVARGVHSMEVYTLLDCNIEARQNFAKQFNTVKDGNGYETLLTVKEKDDAVRIIVKREKNVIKELVILCLDEHAPTIVKLSGKIKEKDIAELANGKYDK